MPRFQTVFRLLNICKDLLREVLTFLPLMVCAQVSLAAEILFLRKQLAFYQERKIKPRRFDDAARLSMLLFAKFFDWKHALINVKPETFTGWHKKAFLLFWRWKSRGGRPRLPRNIQRLIVEMATNNPTSYLYQVHPYHWLEANDFGRRTGVIGEHDRPFGAGAEERAGPKVPKGR
jgi:hypothetical protein